MSTASELPPLLMQAMTEMEPFFEAARGIRAKLETEGWSPTAAETLAMDWLRMVFANARPKT